jgi:hypothetical protein
MDCSRCGKHIKTLDQSSIASHHASVGCKAKARELKVSGGVRKISAFFQRMGAATAAIEAGGPSTSAAPTFEAGEGEGEIGQLPEDMDEDIEDLDLDLLEDLPPSLPCHFISVPGLLSPCPSVICS